MLQLFQRQQPILPLVLPLLFDLINKTKPPTMVRSFKLSVALCCGNGPCSVRVKERRRKIVEVVVVEVAVGRERE